MAAIEFGKRNAPRKNTLDEFAALFCLGVFSKANDEWTLILSPSRR